jgi:hypothetical protein
VLAAVDGSPKQNLWVGPYPEEDLIYKPPLVAGPPCLVLKEIIKLELTNYYISFNKDQYKIRDLFHSLSLLGRAVSTLLNPKHYITTSQHQQQQQQQTATATATANSNSRQQR